MSKLAKIKVFDAANSKTGNTFSVCYLTITLKTIDFKQQAESFGRAPESNDSKN